VSTDRLTPFSYAVLVLVGEGGAGPHDLMQMMRRGRMYWTAAESQWYAEPKRLAGLGLLRAEKRPGRTHERTHYVLTDAGREAIRDWVATPAAMPRVQDEPVVRALAADLADREAIAGGLEALRAQLDERSAQLDDAERVARNLPAREAVLLVNHRYARRVLEAERQWLDEIQHALREGDQGTRSVPE
jgi:PadR family transcriptional regulator, regulatory protein AphA